MNHGAHTLLFAEQTHPAVSNWIENEAAASEFKGERLTRRFKVVLKQLGGASAQSIPWACQDWANAKAAYRFFNNGRVSAGDILVGHFRATRERFAGTSSVILVLHDTTEFSYQVNDRPGTPYATAMT